MQFTPFAQQEDFLKLSLFGNPDTGKTYRAIGAFAGKRGGKTEVGAVGFGALYQNKFAWDKESIDPYVGVILAPTYDMLKRLSWKKFRGYWKSFLHTKFKGTQTPLVCHWHDHVPDGGSSESVIYGISADNPERIEGIKASIIWIDEVFQVSEQFFLECLARTADCGGIVICTGSLGVQFINPKEHWAYKYFKVSEFDGFVCIEWASSENPHFSQEEIENLRQVLDEQTFNAMFKISWDLVPKSAVYHNFSDANVLDHYIFNPKLPLLVSIDWGWTHPMSCGFYQYDANKDIVYKFDEIVQSRMTLDEMYQKICEKPYIKTIDRKRKVLTSNNTVKIESFKFITNVSAWSCDIAGTQEREQTAISNINHFKLKYGIIFKKRKSSILKGIALVRSYIKNSVGEIRFFVSANCKETISGFKRYSYPEKDGKVTDEMPIKKDDDAVDETRYFFWNFLDRSNAATLIAKG